MNPDLVIVWRVVTTCSLGCQFCGYSRVLRRPRIAAVEQDLWNFGRILAEYQQKTGKSILVSWLGGEPLEWSSLKSVSRRFESDYQLRLGVTTNGIPLASPDVRALLLAHYEQVTVSVDGLEQRHDEVRGRSGLFDQLKNSLKQLRSEDVGQRLLLRVNTILMRDNIGDFADFCTAMAEWGFHELTFNQLGGNDRPEFFPANRLLPEQIRRFRVQLPEVAARSARMGLTIRGSEPYLDRIAATADGRRIPVTDCQPGSRYLFVDESGRISPCSFTCSEYGIPLASIPSARAFGELQGRFREQRQSQRHSACDDCHATFVFDKFL